MGMQMIKGIQGKSDHDESENCLKCLYSYSILHNKSKRQQNFSPPLQTIGLTPPIPRFVFSLQPESGSNKK